MSKRYKAKRRERYYQKHFLLGFAADELCLEEGPCWCGEPKPYYAEVEGTCGGFGVIQCYCGGDLCVCHNHGEVECFGCPDCEQGEDDFEPEFEEALY